MNESTFTALFTALLIDLTIYLPLIIFLTKASNKHYKNTSQITTHIITKCKKCQSTDIEITKDIPISQKKQLSFIIKTLGALIFFLILFCILTLSLPKLKQFAINPFYGLLEKSGEIHLSATENIFALFLMFASPINYILFFFLFLNIIFFFSNRTKYEKTEAITICKTCGYINRPSEEKEHNEGDHS